MKKWPIVGVCMLIFLVSISCKALSGTSGQPGDIVSKVTLARDSNPENYAPIDPTQEFGQSDTIHAVVEVNGAPAGTQFKVKWLTVDVGDVQKADMVIDTTETEQSGSGNLDFTLSPDGMFLPGTYKVEVYVNGELVKSNSYKVIQSE
jgi:hypothetical protein